MAEESVVVGRDIDFGFERETKNFFVFAEHNERGEKAEKGEAITGGTIYVRKDFFNRRPGTLTITISVP